MYIRILKSDVHRMYFAYQLALTFCQNWQTLLKDTNKCEQRLLPEIILYCDINQEANKHFAGHIISFLLQ